MTPVVGALLPVFLVILIGLGLRLSRLIADETWPAIDQLCYFVLFPVLIVKTLATADLAAVPVLRIAAAMMSAILLLAALLFVARKPLSSLLGLTPAGFTSLFQGATRWHTFVALAIIAALYGHQGLTVASIGVAAMIPLLNILNVGILTLYGERHDGKRPAIVGMIVRNPFIISCAIGIALNALSIELPTALLGAFDLIGRAALGLALLTVGAALRPAHLVKRLSAVLATGAIRLLLMPLAMVLFCRLYGIGGEPVVIAAICGAVPTASSAYILARQLGGDAELMAAIITFQVLAASLTLPLAIWAASQFAA